jgi:RHS repeat-associated protein
VAGQLIEQKDLDKDGRVISSYTFEYDAVGNIISEASPYLAPSVSLQNIPNINMTYTEDNRLATFNGQAAEFDADGNMITGPLNGQMASYTYDSRNRLVAAGNLTYEYDAENNRISVTENVNGCPVKTEYVVNPHAALSQVLIKTVGNEQTYYVYGLGLIGQEVAGEYSTYHFDLRGSTVAITDANGKVTDRYQYSAYGEILSSSGNTDTPFLYNGRDGVITDANGLYYMRARYYNPEIRRFVSQDILLGVVIDGQSLNRYAYVQGNPVGFVDPLGLAREEGFLKRTTDKAIKWLIENGNVILDRFQTGLDFVGLAPGFGEPADGANAIIYLLRGDETNAALSAGGMIPVAGSFSTGGKYVIKYGDEVIGGIKGTRSTVDPNKLNHIFGKKEHNLDTFLSKFGGDQVKAYNALEKVTQQYVNSNKITGTFKDIIVNVNGVDVTVRGTVINGQVKIGTAFIP